MKISKNMIVALEFVYIRYVSWLYRYSFNVKSIIIIYIYKTMSSASRSNNVPDKDLKEDKFRQQQNMQMAS